MRREVIAIFKQIGTFYNKSSNWSKVLFFIMLMILVTSFFKAFGKSFNKREGFIQSSNFLIKKHGEVYDDFYATVYDHLVFNDIKDDFEIREIVKHTKPDEHSVILDVGSGTGHHVADFGELGYDILGIDKSSSMVSKAKELFPEYKFQIGDAMVDGTFAPGTFTHILCLYFTLYYFKDKHLFFANAMKWLKPGGKLVVHLVDPDNFDPVLPPGSPFIVVNPQSYAKKRITNTKISFDDFKYEGNFDFGSDTQERDESGITIPSSSTDTATETATATATGPKLVKFVEKFISSNNGSQRIRKNEHDLFMSSLDDIVDMAKNVGFTVDGRSDMISISYEYQYLYVFIKNN